jgi:hypothetical protein
MGRVAHSQFDWRIGPSLIQPTTRKTSIANSAVQRLDSHAWGDMAFTMLDAIPSTVGVSNSV